MRHGLYLIAALVVLACGGQSPPAPASPTAQTSAPAAGTLVLNAAPADLGCDAVGVPYRNVTFEIDPTAGDHVTAVADTGTSLRTFWATGFQGGTADDPVVRGPNGEAVAADGETLAIPEGEWPRLHGYFVCPSPDAIYVLVQDPT
jgi:hypothetical protein